MMSGTDSYDMSGDDTMPPELHSDIDDSSGCDSQATQYYAWSSNEDNDELTSIAYSVTSPINDIGEGRTFPSSSSSSGTSEIKQSPF